MIRLDMDGKYDVDCIMAEDIYKSGRRGRPQRHYKVRFPYQQPSEDHWFTRDELVETAPDIVSYYERVRYSAKENVAKPTLVQTCHFGKINDVTFPAGYSQVFASCSERDIKIWHSEECRELLRIQVPNVECLCIAFMPHGKSILSGWRDGKIRAFGPQSGKLLYTIHEAHPLGVTAICGTTEGNRIISGGKEGQVRVWRIGKESQSMIASMKEHKGPVNCIQVRRNDSECVSASSDGSCIIWDLTRFARNSSLFANTFFKAILYHPDESQLLTTGTDRKIEKKISEWVANLSLGEDEEAKSYVTEDERVALASELAAMTDPMERREREEEQKLAWKLRMKREKKRRREEVSKLTAEVAKVQECRKEVLAQPDDKAKWDKVLGYLEVLSKSWMEERQASWSQDVALSAMRSGFRDFAREIVTHIGGEVRQLRDKVGKFCKGAIEGAKAIAAVEGEDRPRKDPVKLKFPDAYGGKKEENFDNWEASVNSYIYLQHILIEEQVIVAFQALKDEAASFARSLVRAAGCENNLVAYSKVTPLSQFLKLLKERFADPTRGVCASDKLQAIHSRQWRSARALKGTMDDLVAVSDYGVTETQLITPWHTFARLVKKERLEEQVFVVYVRPVTEAKEEVSSTDPTIAKLLEEFKDLTESPTGVVSRPIQHRIEIEPGSRTPKGAVYRMSPRELEELRKQLDDLLEKGWIGPSSSPFGAPVLFVPKKEGELRMCIDYRGLNAITVKNVEPLPRIDDLLDRVQGCKYFSKIDLKSGYHQIEVHPDDQYKTAFRTRYGHYEFIVMPFGLTNAPATFQRCMNDLFRPWLDKFVVVYLDDILVFSRTLQEHRGHPRQVLEKLREANFKINAKKCEWAKTQVLYLGHVLDGDGIKPGDSKIAAIRDWLTPHTLTELQLFLGLANYYRKFVRNFSTIAAPLRRLLKKEAIGQWDKDCTSALKRLKRTLIEYPVLKVVDPSLPFVVTTDASQYGIGVVLQQDDGNGYRPVEFMSARMPS
ncbi:hypothetical protein CBR_g57893 [Chara braunii]|uniref:Reverse transcriptase domain-containing protein n=1 Tax=Chara braunii TaxID=69332 RepID=A0A388K897_CHABU|nr:hypothetical protein CBR_g57893 [Chara braunii]|eukprot:GBG66294.1 hypothetical protein CBR_g57893 [Chara braunii]